MNNLIKKITLGTVVGAMVLGTTVFAFADDTDVSDFCTGDQIGRMEQGNFGSGKTNYFMNGNQGRSTKGHSFDEYVELGIISQEEADSISEYLESKREADMNQMSGLTFEERREFVEAKRQGADGTTLFDELVAEGIITAAQVEEMESARQNEMQALAEERHTEMTDNWVEEGIITNTEADAIINYLNEKHDEMVEATANMTPEERRDYHQENRPDGNLVDELLAEGLLSQEQADQIGDCGCGLDGQAQMNKGMRSDSRGTRGRK